MSDDSEVNKVFREFWKPILTSKSGKINMSQVKRELYDYYCIMHEVSIVYDAITGGRISKPNTLHQYVIDEADEYYKKLHSPEE